MDDTWNDFFRDFAVRACRDDRFNSSYPSYPFKDPGCKFHDHGEEDTGSTGRRAATTTTEKRPVLQG